MKIADDAKRARVVNLAARAMFAAEGATDWDTTPTKTLWLQRAEVVVEVYEKAARVDGLVDLCGRAERLVEQFGDLWVEASRRLEDLRRTAG